VKVGIPARTGEWFKVYLKLHDRATKTFSWCWPIDLEIKKFFLKVAQFFGYVFKSLSNAGGKQV